MTRQRVLLDTGPLVAFLNKTDQQHTRITAIFRQLEPPMLTCEPVLTEVCFLLARANPSLISVVFGLLQKQVIKVGFQLDSCQEQIGKLIGQYSNVPMSLADACLVCMSEQYEQLPLLTLDGDFEIYRRFGNQPIPLIKS